MAIFYLIGHGGSGKSLYAKSVGEYESTEANIVYYDEDDKVAEAAGYSSFTELLQNESSIQHFYKDYIEQLKVEAQHNKETSFVVSTGGYSILIDENLYDDGHKIYIRSSLKDILKSVEERKKRGIRFPLIKGFDTVAKNLEYIEFEFEQFKDYYHKADLFYTDKMELLIQNRHDDVNLFDINVERILKYIISLEEKK